MSFFKIIKSLLKWLCIIYISCLLIIIIIWAVATLDVNITSLQDIKSLEFFKEINLSDILNFINWYINLIIRHILDILNSYIQVELKMLGDNESEYTNINDYYDKFKEKILTLFSERPSQDLVLREPSQGPSVRQPEPRLGSGLRQLLPRPESMQEAGHLESIQETSHSDPIEEVNRLDPDKRQLKPIQDGPKIWDPEPISESLDPPAELNDSTKCAREDVFQNKGIKGPGFTGNNLANAFYWNKSMNKNLTHIYNILEANDLKVNVFSKFYNIPSSIDRSDSYVISTVKADYVIYNSTSRLDYEEFLQLEKLVKNFDLKVNLSHENIDAAIYAYNGGEIINGTAFKKCMDIEIANLNNNVARFLYILKRFGEPYF